MTQRDFQNANKIVPKHQDLVGQRVQLQRCFYCDAITCSQRQSKNARQGRGELERGVGTWRWCGTRSLTISASVGITAEAPRALKHSGPWIRLRLSRDGRGIVIQQSTEGTPRIRPDILRTVAVRNEGIAELRVGVRDFMARSGHQRRQERRRDRAEARFRAVLADRVVNRVVETVFPGDSIDRVVEEIAERRVDPYSAADRVMQRMEVK